MAGAGSQQTSQGVTQFDELKDIVSKTLENKGILAKAQAQLRKHVFEVLSLSEQQDKEKYNVGPQINENNIYDKLCLALIRDYLLYHHLDYTLSLMNTESQNKMEFVQNITRNEVASKLDIGAQKPEPDNTLLKQLVVKLFENDVLKPRNSILENDVKLKPRASNDVYRSSIDSINSISDTKNDQIFNKSLDTLTSLAKLPDLPAIPNKHTINNIHTIDTIDQIDIAGSKTTLNSQLITQQEENDDILNDILDEEMHEIDDNDKIDEEELNDSPKDSQDKATANSNIHPLDDLLESLNDIDDLDDEDNINIQNVDILKNDDKDEELKRLEKMNKTMEELKKQTSKLELDKLKQTSFTSTPSGSDIYEDDFGSEYIENQIDENNDVANGDDNNNNDDEDDEDEDEDDDDDMNIEDIDDMDDIDEDIIDEDIEIDDELQTLSNDGSSIANDNIYSAKDVDEIKEFKNIKDNVVTKNNKLENIANIIMDVKTENIQFQL